MGVLGFGSAQCGRKLCGALGGCRGMSGTELTLCKKLLLTANALTELPDSLSSCTSLVTLDVSHNRVSALPAGFGNLAALVEAHLSFNQLSSPLPAGAPALAAQCPALRLLPCGTRAFAAVTCVCPPPQVWAG